MYNPLSMLKPWKPHLGLDIHASLMEHKISTEEATLNVARNSVNKLSDPIFLKELFKSYENEKEAQKKKEVLIIPKTGEKISMPTYAPNNKDNYETFLKFYKLAKKDLKEKGKVSEKTLELIK